MHSDTIFITELGICRIIPNLNQRVAKNKQKKQKIRNYLCDYDRFRVVCQFPKLFFDELKKIRSPFDNRLINRVTTQD